MAKLFSSNKPRVLVVDGDEDFLDLFNLLFGQWFRILTASSYSQALDLINSETFDVVVADIFTHNSPRGTQFLREIEQLRATVPVIFTTNVNSATIVQLTNKAGGYRLIEKNFDDPGQVMKAASYIMAASCQQPEKLSEKS